VTVIVVDGPEKTGKTHTIQRIRDELESRGKRTEYIHWGKVVDETAYSEMLRAHTLKRDKVYVWDRAWPSEYVYSKLMYRGQQHKMRDDPWMGAWLHDRAVDANGLKVMLLPIDELAVQGQRDHTDLTTPVLGEAMLYKDYAAMFGWCTYAVGHDDYTQGQVSLTVADILLRRWEKVTDPARICGPVDSPVLFVGWEKSSRTVRGGWLPFTSVFTTAFGRDIGEGKSIESRWSNAVDLVPEDLARIELVVLCGKQASSIFKSNFSKEVRPGTQIIEVPHPSYLYRFNTSKVREQRAEALNHIQTVLKEL
jgi:hypothetical protein